MVRRGRSWPGRSWRGGRHVHPSGPMDMTATFAENLVGERQRGAKLHLRNCVACHGEKGDGRGPRAYFMRAEPTDFTSDKARAELSRPHLFDSIHMGILKTQMPAWSKVLDEQEIADLAEYVFTRFIRAPAVTLIPVEDGGSRQHDRDAAATSPTIPRPTLGPSTSCVTGRPSPSFAAKSPKRFQAVS